MTLIAAREVQISGKILEQYRFQFTDIMHTQTQNTIKKSLSICLVHNFQG